MRFDLCILNKNVKSWTEQNYVSTKWSEILIPPDLNDNARKLFNLASDYDLECPTIRINNTRVEFKYENNNKYVKLYVDHSKIIYYTFGIIGQQPSNGTLTNLREDLKGFHLFLYG